MKPSVTLLLVSLLTLVSCHRVSYEEKVTRQTAEYNQAHCPQRMDQYTILDSMHYDGVTRTMAYHYTIQGQMDNDTLFKTGQMVDNFRQQLHKNICSSLEIKDLKDHKTTFVYIYMSESRHDKLLQLQFTPKDYQ